MSHKADLKIDALDSFRGNLIHYLERATATLDEVSSEVRRISLWLNEQKKPYWEREVRLRARALEEAQQALFGARLSSFQSKGLQEMAVNRARRALKEAEEKLKYVRLWQRRYEKEVEPLAREIEKLRPFLAQDLKKGVRRLARLRQSLENYVAMNPEETSPKKQVSN